MNAELLAASPDHVALQSALWDAWMLGIAYSLTGAQKYKAQGTAILSTTFTGPRAILPNMRFARMIPETSLDDARVNPLGFYEMNDVGLALDASALLDMAPPTSTSFDQWMWYALPASKPVCTSCRPCGHACMTAEGVCRQYGTWLGERLNGSLPTLEPIDRIWFHTQQAQVFKHIGPKPKLDEQCSLLRALFPSVVGGDGALVRLPCGAGSTYRRGKCHLVDISCHCLRCTLFQRQTAVLRRVPAMRRRGSVAAPVHPGHTGARYAR